MKYRVVATDFDGTLLTSNKVITEENKQAFNECRNNGCITVGITARNLSSIKSVCDIDIFDYLIINNGTYIYNVKEKDGEYLAYIDKSIVDNITKQFLDSSDGIDYCSVNKYYSNKTQLAKRRPFHVEITDFAEVSERIARINIFGKTNEDVYSFKSIVNEKYPELNAITMLDTDSKSDRKWVAVNPGNCNKAIALEKLTNILGCGMQDVLYFGDATNDIEIITQVGCGVAMGNAIDEVKNAANDVTVSNDENGVAYYINKIINN
ncbi:MAG: HAD-IIB family hydrolase [Clostridia bacterium]|nr:HAD-IIB family hydrolase [Clostridia bacterium]